MRKGYLYFSIFGLIAFVAVCFFIVFIYMRIVYPLAYVKELNAASEKYNLEPALIASLINAESSFNSEVVSSKGAVGLMQLLPSTAVWISDLLGIKNFKEEDLFIPSVNIELGTFYMSYLKNKFTDTKTALAAYNAGEGIVKKWLESSEYSTDKISLYKIPYSETDNYIKKIERNLKHYSKKF